MEHLVSFHLGLPVRLMKLTLSVSEYNKWVAYFKFKTPDAQEIQLATIGLIISQGLGNKKAKFKDFLVNTNKLESTNSEKATAYDSFAAMATPYTGG